MHVLDHDGERLTPSPVTKSYLAKALARGEVVQADDGTLRVAAGGYRTPAQVAAAKAAKSWATSRGAK